MILEIIIGIIIGVLAGTITGLAPGIHINLIAAILVASLASPILQSISLIALVVFIVSMSITHTFIDFIPSIFLGAPEEDSFLSILPGHKMLLEGKGHEAFVLTLYGSLSALPIILIFTPIFIYFLPSFFNLIKAIIPFILIFISLFLIFREDNFLNSLVIFILAGYLGYFTFNLPVEQPLMPLLTGLFGVSSLIITITNKTQPIKQIIPPLKKIKLTKSQFLKSFSASFFSAPLCSFLPGIGSGHAALIGSELIKHDNRSFLFLVGSINTIIMALSFITVFSIGKSRTGSAAAIKDILNSISLSDLFIILITIVISSILAFFLGIFSSKIFAKYISKINYSKLSIFIILLLIIFNVIFSNPIGLLVLITSSALGTFCILSNSRRINLMGCLLVPAIVFYLTL